jgi:hypothetical protein
MPPGKHQSEYCRSSLLSIGIGTILAVQVAQRDLPPPSSVVPVTAPNGISIALRLGNVAASVSWR